MDYEKEYEEIQISEIFRVVWSKKWWIVIIISISVVLGVLTSSNTPTSISYSAKTNLVASYDTDKVSGETSETYLATGLTQDYVEFVKTNRVVEDAIKKLDFEINYQDFIEIMQVSSVNNTGFISIVIDHEEADKAEEMANAISESLVETSNRMITHKTITIVDEAFVNKIEEISDIKGNLLISIIMGVAIAAFVIIAFCLLDNKIRKEEDIYRIVGLSVLGVVPKTSSKGSEK